MGGPSTSGLESTGRSQSQIGEEERQFAREDRAQMKALTAPLIEKETALAKGDRGEALSAAMPAISNVSAGFNAAKQSIANQMPPGAARDQALANLEVTKDTTIGGAQAQMVAGAPEVLANVGSGMGAFSLQELGAALSGFSGSSQTQQAVVEAKNAEKANSLQFFGSLVGAGGKVAAGFTPHG